MSKKAVPEKTTTTASRVTLGFAFLFAILALLFLCLLFKPALGTNLSKLSGIVDLPEASGIKVMRMVWAAQLIFASMSCLGLFLVLKGRLRAYTTFAMGAGLAVATSLLTANLTLTFINAIAMVVIFGFRIRKDENFNPSESDLVE